MLIYVNNNLYWHIARCSKKRACAQFVPCSGPFYVLLSYAPQIGGFGPVAGNKCLMEFYLYALYRNVTIWPLVQGSSGAKLVADLPAVMSFANAHATAFA